MIPENRTDRVWGSVCENGVVRCEIRDVPVSDAVLALGGEVAGWRVWRVMMVDHLDDVQDPDDDCDGPAACYPGHPCPRCQVTAVRWWHEYGKRLLERRYYPCNEKVLDRTRASVANYCKHTHGHPDEADAMRCAKRHGWPLIMVRDGNGKRLDLHPSGPQLPLLPEAP